MTRVPAPIASTASAPTPISLAMASASARWPASYSTIVAERLWSDAFVTLPILKPLVWIRFATPRARPGTVVPLSTATVVSAGRTGDVVEPESPVVSVPPAAGAEPAIVFAAGFGSSPPPRTCVATTTPMIRTSATAAMTPSVVLRPGRFASCSSSSSGQRRAPAGAGRGVAVADGARSGCAGGAGRACSPAPAAVAAAAAAGVAAGGTEGLAASGAPSPGPVGGCCPGCCGGPDVPLVPGAGWMVVGWSTVAAPPAGLAAAAPAAVAAAAAATAGAPGAGVPAGGAGAGGPGGGAGGGGAAGGGGGAPRRGDRGGPGRGRAGGRRGRGRAGGRRGRGRAGGRRGRARGLLRVLAGGGGRRGGGLGRRSRAGLRRRGLLRDGRADAPLCLGDHALLLLGGALGRAARPFAQTLDLASLREVEQRQHGEPQHGCEARVRPVLLDLVRDREGEDRRHRGGHPRRWPRRFHRRRGARRRCGGPSAG